MLKSKYYYQTIFNYSKYPRQGWQHSFVAKLFGIINKRHMKNIKLIKERVIRKTKFTIG